MSAQTGVAAPDGPASQRLVDRARFRAVRLKDEPNPIWIRELKQAARVTRTPIALATVTVVLTLVLASIGGIMSAGSSYSPADTGVALFQSFFSAAYFVVTLFGPAIAANSIASEREGRTWEAVLLTGLRPGVIARGKFLAAYTAIAMYVVMLAPVGALPFLFGGVTATEVIVAFVFLFLIALLSVAFGLAMSSKMASTRAAILVTLLLAFPFALTAFLGFGVGLSYGAHAAWPGVPEGPPVWLPTAYARAPFDLTYAVFLIALPLVGVTLPAWFLYEVTIANLSSVTDDRSTGLKRWFLVAVPAVTVASGIPAITASASGLSRTLIGGACVLVGLLSYAVFLFAGDPIGPSRRVTAAWDRARASRFRRFLGPGVVRSAVLLLVAGLAAIAALTGAGTVLIAVRAPSPEVQVQELLVFTIYAAAFHVLVVGAGAWLRARSQSAGAARILLFTGLFAIAAGPWMVMAIAGVITESDAHVVACASPFYAFFAVDEVHKTGPGSAVIASLAASTGWALLGALLFTLARRRCNDVIGRHEAALANADRLLAEEDAAHAGAPPPAAPAATAAPAPTAIGETPLAAAPAPTAAVEAPIAAAPGPALEAASAAHQASAAPEDSAAAPPAEPAKPEP